MVHIVVGDTLQDNLCHSGAPIKVPGEQAHPGRVYRRWKNGNEERQGLLRDCKSYTPSLERPQPKTLYSQAV